MISDKSVLKAFLEEKYLQYNQASFIETDPVSIPHQFSIKEDIEISAFLSATIAWGQRVTIVNNGRKLMNLMGNSPLEFVMEFKEKSQSACLLSSFVHRTFNSVDLIFFIISLQNIYKNKGGLENIFKLKNTEENVFSAIINARNYFFEPAHLPRTKKHFSDPSSGSAAKRVNMFLRWMVRKDHIDFGLWKNIQASQLICPLDLHSGNVSRKIGILKRKQNDWKAAEELTDSLRELNEKDPVKYDISLFGLGIFEKF